MEKVKEEVLSDYKYILTIKDIMEIFSIGKSQAYKLLHSGELEYFKLGRNIKIPKSSVIDYINNIMGRE